MTPKIFEGRGRRLVAAGVVLAAVVVAAGVSTFRYFGTEAARATLSNRGTPVPISDHDQRILASMGGFTGEMYLLRSEAGHDFYRVPKTDGSDCFGASLVGSPVRLGALLCSPDFPAQRPILDFSVFGADKPETGLHVVSVQGIAADDVAEIRVVSRANEILRTVPVEGNVYALGDPSTLGTAAVSVVAIDRDGNVLFRSGPGGNS